ncbi:MAG: DUF116 domain-containing protein [Bilophila wadsworthia]
MAPVHRGHRLRRGHPRNPLAFRGAGAPRLHRKAHTRHIAPARHHYPPAPADHGAHGPDDAHPRSRRAPFLHQGQQRAGPQQRHQCEPRQLLVLLPHCIQSSRCTHRLTYHIDNCARCGACPLKDVLNLRDTYGVQVAIATGGTIARRIVVQARPKLIVAVACERDLSSGIQDTHPLPVFGVINERPNGPCLDTFVSIRRSNPPSGISSA